MSKKGRPHSQKPSWGRPVQWAMCSLVSRVHGVTDGWAGLLHTHQPIHTSCCLVIVVCYINTFIHNMVQIDFMVSDIYGVRKS